MEGIFLQALVDTGASISVMRKDLCARLRKVKTPYFGPPLCSANGSLITPIASCTARVLIGEDRHHIEFAVLSECAHDLIFGWDFLSSASAVISCRQPTIHISNTEPSPAPNSRQHLLTLRTDCVLPPGCEQIVMVSSSSIFEGDVIASPSSRLVPRGIAMCTCLVRFSQGSAPLAALNTTTEPIVLPKGMAIASVVDKDPVSVLSNTVRSARSCDFVSSGGMSSIAASISPDLTPKQHEQLLTILTKHVASFDVGSTTLKRTTVAAHRIETDGSGIVRRRPYRVSLHERKIIEEQVAEMLKRDVIRPSSSSWSSPVVLVEKKDGSVRFCVDYRALNKITRKDVYPMPRIDDALDTLQGAEYFSSLDLRSGYWQIPMHEDDKEKTAFATPDGLYEFNVMPFGLCNAPATFERMIDTVLRGLKWKTCLCYLDDIVIFSTTFDQHLQRLDEVLSCLSNAGLQINTKKCTFASRSIKVLGHVVSKKGIQPDPEKISAVLNFPRPQQQKDLRSFLGLGSYFRRFIRNFATVASPLHHLLRPGIPFVWTEDCERAFQALKDALTSSPVLCHFNDSAPTILHTDASGQGIGAVLLQLDAHKKERVVAYASRALTAAERNYSITEQECLAVVWAVQKFRPYLHGRFFTIVTDHHALCWLSTLKNLSGRLGRWVLRLQQYSFTVTYKSGKKHLDADALSRCPLPEPPASASASTQQVLPIATIPCSTIGDTVNLPALQRDDTYCRRIIERIEGSARPPNSRLRRQLNNFQLVSGVLCRYSHHPAGSRWVTVLPRRLRAGILEAFHDDASAGHLGFEKTYERIRSRFFWPGMSTSVAKYISSCVQCQHRKRVTSSSSGPLQPAPCPPSPFHTVGIDLYGPLPCTPAGYRWIVTAVDHLTRYAETSPLRSGCAQEIADFVLQSIILRHGAPRILLSDRGRAFLSQILAEVLRAANTVHKTTSGYHPQTNGITERFHRTLSDMLSMYIKPDHTNWDQILPFVTFAYNTAIQRTTGYSPFFLVFGRSPSFIIDTSFFSAPDSLDTPFSDVFISRLNHCRRLARLHTEAMQQERKRLYDSTHRSVHFHPGEEVLLWTPVRSPGLCEKFLHRYIGPYIVVEQTSPVNYRVSPVAAPTDRRRRSTEVVHVSRMKRYTKRTQ